MPHFNKSSGTDTMGLIMGSAAFGNVVRAVLGFIRDDEAEDNSVVISQLKNNLGRLDLPNLRYKIEEAHLDTPKGQTSVGRLVMMAEADRSVEEILRDAKTSPEERSKRDEAIDWLKDFLDSRGGVKNAAVCMAEAERAGISKRRVQRAKARKDAGLDHHKLSMLGGWIWFLSTLSVEEARDTYYKNNPSTPDMSTSSPEDTNSPTLKNSGIFAPSGKKRNLRRIMVSSKVPKIAPKIPKMPRCQVTGKAVSSSRVLRMTTRGY